MKKLVLVCFLGIFVIGFSMQSAMAGMDWKENQRKIFAQIPVKPGDVIDKSNWEKVKDLLPPSVLNWIKKGDFIIKIGEFKYDYAPDEAYLGKSALNKGKYKLGKNREIVDAATGKAPSFVTGYPFPEIDLENDPYGGIKIMHNEYQQQYRVGNSDHIYTNEWVGEDGYERAMTAMWKKFYYWDNPKGEMPNPNRYLFTEITQILAPYDIAGTVNMCYRMMDGSPDKVFCYIPSIRRVKKLSGANRSDPFFGMDLVQDDGNGWYGNNSSFKWKFIEEKIILYPVVEVMAERPSKFTKLPDGTWRSPGHSIEPAVIWGYQEEEWKGAPWAPINAVWIPRIQYIVRGDPLDPYYNYGKQYFYLDKDSLTINWKIIYDKAGEYWKTILQAWRCSLWDDDNKKSFANITFIVGKDDKTNHASICNAGGRHRGFDNICWFNSPRVNPRMFTPEKLATMSK